MTLDRWIALGACIAAFFSAIAAFFVVAQSSLQRKLAYKPQLVFRPLTFKYQINNKKVDILNKINFIYADNTLPHKSDIASNIGLGTAIDVSIHWHFDLEGIVKKLNNLFNEDGGKIKLVVNENLINLDVPSNGHERYTYSRINTDETIDYILPYNQNKNQVNILIPHTYFSLNCALLIYSLKSGVRMDRSESIITLNVKHHDIGGVSYNQDYEVRTNFHHSQSNDENTIMYGELLFTKKHQGKTTTGLARIRKSYVDFMNEHDFNKNR